MAREWCSRVGQPGGELLDLDTGWNLAKAWYHDRLDPHWRRKPPREVEQLFAFLGLHSEFWRLW